MLKKAPASFATAIPGEPAPGSTPVYRHPDFTKELKTRLHHGMEDVDTLWGIFERAATKHPGDKCHGKRSTDKKGKVISGFTFTTYGQVYERIKNFASGIKDEMKKDVTGQYDLLGLMGVNASEWSIAELSCMSMSGTTVPLYSNTPSETVEYLINQNGCATVVCDANNAKILIKAKPNTPTFTTIVVYQVTDSAVEEELRNQSKAVGLKFLKFEEVEAAGKANPKEFVRPGPDTIFSFIYTSGSTGMPKGALLSHSGQLSVLAGSFVNTEASGIFSIPRGEFHLSYLPSAHIMERAFAYNIYIHNGAIGYFQGKRELLIEDLANLRPTSWPTVPRLMNLISDKILNQVRSSSPLKQRIFNAAYQAKLRNLKKGKLTHPLWDKLVFGKIKKKLGLDRCNFLVTGSAPVSGAVLDFFRAVFGLYVIEGYGMSETAASTSLTHPLYFSSEHVGGPSPNVEVKLVSIPEMNYLVTDTDHKGMAVKGRGEVCVRGKCVMKEYYRNPEATAKVLDADGWYHTGDVGCFLPNGCIKIFDRVSNVFKLSIGEYVAPEKVENVCTRSQFVASTLVHGDGLHNCLVAIVVLDEDAVKMWAKENGKEGTDFKTLAATEELRQAVLKDIAAIGRAGGLVSYEIPKDVFLDTEPWTPDNILTATQKMQRKKAVAYYETQIRKMLGEPN